MTKKKKALTKHQKTLKTYLLEDTTQAEAKEKGYIFFKAWTEYMADEKTQKRIQKRLDKVTN